LRRADAGLGLVPPVLGVGAPAVERRAVQRKYPLLAASPCHRCLRAELLAVRYSANEARCSGERLEPCAFMMPLVSASTMKSGDIACSEFAGGRARRRIVVADRTGLLEHRLLRALRRWCKLHRRGAGRRHHDRPGKNEDAPEPCVAARYHWLKNSPRARLAAPANVTGIPGCPAEWPSLSRTDLQDAVSWRVGGAGGPRGMVYARRRAGQDHQGTKRLSRSPGTNPAADAIDLRGGFTHRAQDSDGISLAR
jgi:hypothetical protein